MFALQQAVKELQPAYAPAHSWARWGPANGKSLLTCCCMAIDVGTQGCVCSSEPAARSVWCVLAFTLLFGAIFSFLAWDVFLDFRRVVRDPHFTAMAGNDKHAWAQLFMGAAGSAFFAVVLVVVFAVCAIYYMLLHRKGLSHPVQNFGRGFLVALSFMGCLHIANIATHFLSFAPAMGHWIVDYKVDFNRVLLDSTFVVGYASSLFFLAFALLLLFWRRTDVDISYQEIPPN